MSLRKVARVSNGSERVAQPIPPVLRTAQLEGDEEHFGHRHRKIAFQNGLQRVNQQSGSHQVPKQPNQRGLWMLLLPLKLLHTHALMNEVSTIA